MAILAKKIHITNSAGEEQTVNLYGTVAELGGATGYTTQLVDGQECYAVLIGTGESGATAGRVQLSTGDVYAWGVKTPVPSYGYRTITSGSGTFTVPAGASKLRVTCVSGGSGGNSALSIPTGSSYVGWHYRIGGDGGATTFGSVTAPKTTGSGVQGECYRYTDTCTSNSGRDGSSTRPCTKYGVRNKTVVYGTGSSSPYYAYSADPYSAPSVAVYNIQGTHVMTVGWGGHVDGTGAELISGCAGNKVTQTIDVQSGQVISYSVGAGGHCWNGSYTCGSTMCGGSGLHCTGSGSGGILIEWGEGVE